VKGQEIALVDRAYWHGDNTTSGLVGLAYSTLTSAFVGTDATLDNPDVTGTAPGNRIHYFPIVTSMIAQGLDRPLFSLSLKSPTRNNSFARGYLAFGGLPPVSIDPAAFASTPIVPLQYSRYSPAVNLGFYSIMPEAYVYNGLEGVATDHRTEIHAVVDSGTSILRVSISTCPDAFFELPLTSTGASRRCERLL